MQNESKEIIKSLIELGMETQKFLDHLDKTLSEKMTLKKYQQFCRTTDLFPPQSNTDWAELMMYRTLCLCGEVGELANKVKKIKRDSPNFITPKIRHSIINEIGDIMWYISILADLFEASLEYVLEQNVQKLTYRKEQNKICGNGDNR